jgi:hypothetical protein
MPASILATVAAALLAAAWLLGRRRPAVVRQLDTSAVAALNRAQIALVQGGLDRPAAAPERGDEAASLAVGAPGRFANGAPAPGRGATKTGGWADGWAAGLPPLHAGLIPPGDQRLRFRAQLQARFQQGGAARLQAIQLAHRWGDRSLLPLLRRGLRDPDPAVVRAAAAAIDRYRGRPSPSAVGPLQPAGRPRRVARTL